MPEVISRIDPRLREALQRYRLGDRSVALTGPSGCGKTTWCALTVLRYIAWATSAECDPLSPEASRLGQASRLGGFTWLVAHDLVRARREYRLGEGEAPLVEQAKWASVVVLDELGAEPASELPFEIIDARYAAGRPTLVTSGLTPKGFRDRYGDALWRRLTENGCGASLNLHEGGEHDG